MKYLGICIICSVSFICSKEDAYVSLEQQSLQQQAVVSDLSHQMQVHQTNVHSLREELSLVRLQGEHVQWSPSKLFKDTPKIHQNFLRIYLHMAILYRIECLQHPFGIQSPNLITSVHTIGKNFPLYST